MTPLPRYPWASDTLSQEDYDSINDAFNALATIPSVSSAQITPTPSSSSISIQVTFQQRDLSSSTPSSLTKKKYSQTFTALRRDGVELLPSSLPIELSASIPLSSVSPSGKYITQARIVAVDAKTGASKSLWIDFLQRTTLVTSSINVTTFHDDFYTDSFFGAPSGLSWSHDDDTIVYVAQRKPSQDPPTFKYAHAPDWGEAYTGKRTPVIVVANRVSARVTVIDPPGMSPGQPILVGSTIVFHGLVETVPLNGALYCFNRPGGIYKCNLDGTGIVCISQVDKELKLKGARSPRLLPDGDTVVFLSNPVDNATHNSCATLVQTKLDGSRLRVLVPPVISPASTAAFPGLYVDTLLPDPILTVTAGEGVRHFVILVTPWRSTKRVVWVDVQSGEMGKVEPPNGAGKESWTVLDVDKDAMVLLKSEPNSVGELFLVIAQGLTPGNAPLFSFGSLIQAPPHPLLSGFSYSIFTSQASPTVESIILHPPPASSPSTLPSLRKRAKPPLVVVPHGGPNSVFQTEWALNTALLAALGFCVVLVNYTGSIGFGQESIDSLVSHIGSLDVADVHSVALHLTSGHHPNVVVDPALVFLYGGSHGGFITGHLIAMQPEFYRGAVLRNPVANVGLLAQISDIPDWGFECAGIPYDFATPPVMTPQHYAAFWVKSPIAGVKKVQTPTLFMLGETDRRVPNPDGLAFHNHLRARGKPSYLCTFPGTGHPLDSVEAEKFGCEAMLTFFVSNIGAAR
ncbi:alpha/beta-hydrolase [Gonapodya prolifera JEL478]|uniref:acylaminoacyl-peptidase n=1 Tax=Gonapodya prolifera (strain JEL478) TaxID=1344416 RepID=A0A139A249_GONPJ|nr:alpha/beta-hydrolase [Gonapodya prolifera JEL478]|eukprot:KXS10433.1 alpha/beta-hydrolase [Gonapodya prolifera JEL478]